MSGTVQLGILSDIHYAGAAERARGNDYEPLAVPNLILRRSLRLYRRYVWMHEPLSQNYLLDRFLERSGECEFVVANGDYSCDSRFVGVSDDAVCQSVAECLGKLRQKFGNHLLINYGDHELGKVSFFGGRGGMRLASWDRALQELGLKPFWKFSVGRYVLMGVVSSLVGLPIFEADTLPVERQEWQRLRADHLEEIRQAFAELKAEHRVLLFCHDPTALPFLGQEPAINAKIGQVEQTIIGHLHSNLIFWKSRLLAGIPRITFLGHTAKRMSSALSKAKEWKPFHVRLCPALAGIELLKDGGYLTAQLELDGNTPVRFRLHRLRRERTSAR
jgi:hypothetical protein